MAIGDAAFSRGDVMRRLALIEDELRQLRAARRLEAATIGEGGLRVKGEGGITLQNGGDFTVEDGGDVTIRDGGELRVLHPSGAEMLSIFRGSNGQYRIYIRRDSGASVMQLLPHGDSGKQFWVFHDISGAAVISDDAEAGRGLARPWLPVPMAIKFQPDTPVGDPYGYASIDAGHLSSQTQLWEGRVSITHPRITVDGVWGRGSGDVATTYRLKINGTTVGSWNETDLIVAQRGPFDVADLVGTDWATVEITCVVTSGTGGAVACQVLASYLHQS